MILYGKLIFFVVEICFCLFFTFFVVISYLNKLSHHSVDALQSPST